MNGNSIIVEIEKINRKNRKKTALLAAAAALSVLLCFCSGASGLGISELFRVLTGAGTDGEKLILLQIRLPRVTAAALAGVGLSVSGCIMQKVLNNPLASPSTLGVSNGAVFGANCAILLFGAGSVKGAVNGSLTVSNPYTVTICAFTAAFLGIAVNLVLAAKKRFSSETVVLCGVAVGAFFTAGTTVLQYFSSDSQLSSAVFWSFGDLGRASFRECVFMSAVIVPAVVFTAIRSRDIDLLEQGGETALSLGVNVTLLRFVCLILSSLICAVCVSFIGIIGFIGLTAPQAAKRIVGGKMSILLPSSALCGMILLLLSDTVARSVISGVSLPVGAVTSLFGGPVFLWLLLNSHRGGNAHAFD